MLAKATRPSVSVIQINAGALSAMLRNRASLSRNAASPGPLPAGSAARRTRRRRPALRPAPDPRLAPPRRRLGAPPLGGVGRLDDEEPQPALRPPHRRDGRAGGAGLPSRRLARALRPPPPRRRRA